MKEDILNFSYNELKEVIPEITKEKKFRSEQIFTGLHRKVGKDFNSIKGIGKNLKECLEKKFRISQPFLIKESISKKDNTHKFLFGFNEQLINIETVLIKEKDRKTICISTQAGCNAGCEFCATAKIGFKKNLTAGEIVSQIYETIRITGEKPTNIVYMGMGEPLLNYENVLKSLEIITDEKGINIPSKKITVSTIGFKNRIKKFADDLSSNRRLKNTKLAISLHSTDNGLREILIPTSKNNKLKDIYDEIIYFYRKTGNKITYEYIFFEGLNDTSNDINRLIKLSRMVPSNINVIPFHNVDFPLIPILENLKFNNKKETKEKTSFSLSNSKIFDFISELRKNKITVNLRTSSGEDINAACGQLAGKIN